MQFRLAARARRDLVTVLQYSLHEHGAKAASRYELLLMTAIGEISRQPLLDGSCPVECRPGVRSYAIVHSRLHVPHKLRVRRPAHKVVYRVAEDGIVDILGIVGESYPAARTL